MIALLALSALFSTASAQEGGYDAHGRALAATDGDPLDPLWGFRAERQLANSFGGAATLSFANAPLVRITTDGTDRTRERIVDDLLGVTLTGQFALHERVAIGLSAPVWFTSLSDAGRAGPALGDVRLSVPVGLVLPGQAGEGFGLSLIPLADLPSGAQRRWLGDSVPGVGGVLALAIGTGAVHFAADVGAMTAPAIGVDGLAGGAHLLADASVGYALKPDTVARLEMRFDPTLKASDVAWVGSPGEVALSVRKRPEDGGLGFMGAASTAVTRGAGAAGYRLFAGLSYSKKVWPEPDTDRDGLVDSLDACPLEPEVVNGWKDDEGCPDALASLTVTAAGPAGAVADASVRSDSGELGRTAASGELLLVDLMPGTALGLFVEHPTYQPAQVERITLAEGAQSVRVPMAWKPGELIVDTVDATSGARVQATVTLVDAQPAVSPATIGDAPVSWTLAPGDVRVVVQAEGYGDTSEVAHVQPADKTAMTLQLHPAKVTVEVAEVKILEQVLFDFDKATIKA